MHVLPSLDDLKRGPDDIASLERRSADPTRRCLGACTMVANRARWESAKVSHNRVFALLTPEIRS